MILRDYMLLHEVHLHYYKSLRLCLGRATSSTSRAFSVAWHRVVDPRELARERWRVAGGLTTMPSASIDSLLALSAESRFATSECWVVGPHERDVAGRGPGAVGWPFARS